MNPCEKQLGRAYITNALRTNYPRPVGVVGYPFSLRRKRPVFESRTGRQIIRTDGLPEKNLLQKIHQLHLVIV